MKRLFPTALLIISTALLASAQISMSDSAKSTMTKRLPYQLFGRVRVIDGRTLEFLKDETVVRIAGYEASELGQVAQTDDFDWPVGQVARAWMILRTLRQDVNCAPLQFDANGIVLAHCFVGDTNLAASAISEGIGYAFNYPDEPGVPAYFDLERRARGLGFGVWSTTGLAPPWQYRQSISVEPRNQRKTVDDPIGSLPLPPPADGGGMQRRTERSPT